MNTKNNSVIAYALGAIIFAFSTAAAFGQVATPDTQSQFVLYGMHFINGGQTVRVSLQNPRYSDSEIVPCIKVRVVFDVYEAAAAGDGSVRLRFGRRVSREFLLDGGEAATFDFIASSRGEHVSPAVFASPEENEPGPVRLLSTAAVRLSGFTLLNLPIVEKGFDPQPDPPR